VWICSIYSSGRLDLCSVSVINLLFVFINDNFSELSRQAVGSMVVVLQHSVQYS